MLNRRELRRHKNGEQEQYNRRPARDGDIMPLRRSLANKAAVKVVHEIGRAPVELRRDGRHVCRGEPGHHEATPGRRQEIDESLHVRGFVIALAVHHDAVRV